MCNITKQQFRGYSATARFSHPTPTSYQRDPFQNANKGLYNNPGAGGGVQLSSKAQMMMTMLSLMSAFMGGDLGQLMNMLSPQQGRGTLPASPQNPGFGTGRAAGRAAVGALPQAKPGEVKEMKAGQVARGANGSVVKWGKDGLVDIGYKDRDGRPKNIQFKNGMISLDGGPPQKLDNTGQFLKLPNGDVVGLGHNPKQDGSKDLVRVALSDSVDNVPVNPKGASNVYQVGLNEFSETRNEGVGISLNLSQGSFSTPHGGASFMNASISAFTGVPVTRNFSEQFLRFSGVR